jgi:hypothetical protein
MMTAAGAKLSIDSLFWWAPLGRRLAARQAFRKASGLAISAIFAWGRFGFTKVLCLRHHHISRRVC